jgi:hypothetical protein
MGVTIVGDTEACGGPCVLEIGTAGRHFTLFSSGLKLVNVTLRGGVSDMDGQNAYANYKYAKSVNAESPFYLLSGTYGGGAVVYADQASVLEVEDCSFEANVGSRGAARCGTATRALAR